MAARFDSIELVVSDMEATLEFYRRLGLDIPEDAGSEGHVAVELPGGVKIQFDTEEIMQSFSDWTPPTGGGHRMALAFECDSPSEVDAVFAQMIEYGAPSHLEPMDASWGQRYATMLDPNGNPVDLFAPL